VNGCRAHRAPFVLGHQNTTLHELQTGDRSRATDTGAYGLENDPAKPYTETK
jgi:hypothetical protein